MRYKAKLWIFTFIVCFALGALTASYFPPGAERQRLHCKDRAKEHAGERCR